jgi:hypothetical protein
MTADGAGIPRQTTSAGKASAAETRRLYQVVAFLCKAAMTETFASWPPCPCHRCLAPPPCSGFTGRRSGGQVVLPSARYRAT